MKRKFWEEKNHLNKKNMKTIETDNKTLLEVLTDNGITITCNAEMQMTMTDEDAAKVAEIVNRFAPAAAYDYVIINV